MNRRRVWVAWLCALALWGGRADAGVLAPAAVAGSVFFNLSPPPAINFGELGTFSISGPGGMVQFTSTAAPTPALWADVDVNSNFFGRSSGMLVYQMQILGPGGTVPVSVQVAGSASGESVTGDVFAGFALKSAWRLEDLSAAALLVNDEGIITPGLQGSFSETFAKTYELLLTVGHIYRITLVADVGAAAGSGETAFGSAFIDPLFTFGPGVGPEFSFDFSEGIGNAAGAATPEPGWMGVMGLMVVTVIGVKKRRAAH